MYPSNIVLIRDMTSFAVCQSQPNVMSWHNTPVDSYSIRGREDKQKLDVPRYVGVEMLANSLQSNTTLKTLSIEGEGIILTEGAYVAFLKVLNDVTSINSTCQSNHILIALGLPYEKMCTKEMLIIKDHVNLA